MAQAKADHHFEVYQAEMLAHPERLLEEYKKWPPTANVIHLSLGEQAKCADYVTQKMCEEEESIFLEFAETATLPRDKDVGSCAIGNVAAIILALPSTGRGGLIKERLEADRAIYMQEFYGTHGALENGTAAALADCSIHLTYSSGSQKD